MGQRGPPWSVFTLGAQAGFQTLIIELLNKQPEGKQGHMQMQNFHLYYRPFLMLLFPMRSAARIWVTAYISAAVSPTDNIWVLWSLCNTVQKQSTYWHISIYYISISSSYHVIINPESSSKNERIMDANAKAPA